MNSIYKNKCPFCDVDTREDLEHMIMFCKCFEEERAKYLRFLENPNLKKPPDPGIIKKNIINLLGGGIVASSGKTPYEVFDLIKYLSQIVPKRAKKIKAL